MPSATLTVRVDARAKKRLEKLAKRTGRSRSLVAAEAINEYLDVNEWQVAGIKLRHRAGRAWRVDPARSGPGLGGVLERRS